jgi:hypothetical protein
MLIVVHGEPVSQYIYVGSLGIPIFEGFHSFVMTIERVSTDSRGVAPSGEFGLMKETCGQTDEVYISFGACLTPWASTDNENGIRLLCHTSQKRMARMESVSQAKTTYG